MHSGPSRREPPTSHDDLLYCEVLGGAEKSVNIRKFFRKAVAAVLESPSKVSTGSGEKQITCARSAATRSDSSIGMVPSHMHGRTKFVR